MMLDIHRFDLLESKAVTWFTDHVWTQETLVQGSIILVAALLAGGIYHLLSMRTRSGVNRLRKYPRLRRFAGNARRLIVPCVMLFLLALIKANADFSDPPTHLKLIDAAVNLLLAWVVIRLAVQVIGNQAVRNIFALGIWAIAALHIVGLLEATATMLDHMAMNFGHFRLSMLSVIKGLFALCVLLYGATFIASIIERRVRLSKDLTPSSKILIGKTARILLIIFALLIAITSAGIDLSLLAIFSGGIGIGIGFGLQKVASNLLSGMLLLLDRSIKPGDIIEMPNGAFGWVELMGARYTEIVTRDNKSYLIPNENFITQQVVNWSHGDTLVRLEVDFGVHYDSDPHQVITLANVAGLKPDRVVKNPPPGCHLAKFGESSLDFKLHFWIRDAENGIMNIQGDVMLALWDVLKENNIQIPYPHRMVFLHHADEAAKA